jgi:hypothetical protein
MAIKITKSYLTKNDVYTNNLGRVDDRYKTFQDNGPQGLVIHSVGTPQPKASVFIKSWNKPGVEKAVHAFIEPNAIYQTLPWNYRGWHAGGTANNTHIGVEMTEPSTIKYTGGSSWVDLDPKATEAHIRATYANAVELFADLCKQFNLDPLADGVIISHAEGHKRGIASNHGDPEHIWKKFGLSMDLFRAAIAEKMRTVNTSESVLYRVQTGAFRNRKSAEELVAKLKAAGFDAIIKTEAAPEAPKHRTGTVKVTSTLNIRSGPGTNYDRAGSLTNGTKVTIVEEKNGWGKLLQGGWVSLDYIV